MILQSKIIHTKISKLISNPAYFVLKHTIPLRHIRKQRHENQHTEKKQVINMSISVKTRTDI